MVVGRLSAGLLAVAVACLPLAAQSAGPYQAPRASDGHADLQGEWSNASITPLQRPDEFKGRAVMDRLEASMAEQATRVGDPTFTAFSGPGPRVATVNGEPRTSFITFPADGRIPPRKEALAPRGTLPPGGAGSDNPETAGERCIDPPFHLLGPVMLPFMPFMADSNNYQIVQTRDAVVIQTEVNHAVRIIPLNDVRAQSGIPSRLGDSTGRWDGDSLVVETVNFSPQTRFYGASPHLKVTERFTRVGPTRLLYQFRVEDSSVWTQPWGGEYEFAPALGPIYEYACHEGNYTLANILAGARYQEAAARR